MKSFWKKLICVLAAFVLFVSMLPEITLTSALAVGTYGKTNKDAVNVRMRASTDSEYWFRLPIGYVFQIDAEVTQNGTDWYRITVTNPDTSTTREYQGYIMRQFVSVLTDAEATAWEAHPVQTSIVSPATTLSTGEECNGAIGSIISGGVNVRESNSTSAHSMVRLDGGYVLELLAIPATIDSEHWFKVRYEGKVGYIMSNYVKVLARGNLTPEDNNETAPGSDKTPTPTTTPTPAASVDPSVSTAPTATSAVTATPVADYGYAQLTKSSANLRKTPDGKKITSWVGKGSRLQIAGPSKDKSGYTWYPVYYEGSTLYVRGDCIKVVNGPATTAPTATPAATATVTGTAVPATTAPAVTATAVPVTAAPTATANIYGYVKTIRGEVNLRLTPAGEVIQTVNRGVVAPCVAAAVEYQNYTWYYVQVDNVKGYLRGDCVEVCDASGKPVTGPTATAAPTATPVDYGYIKTTAKSVNVRRTPGGDSMEQLAINTVLAVTGPVQASSRYSWYPVTTAAGNKGWIRSDCVTPCRADGTLITDPTATPVVTLPPDATATPVPAPTATVGYGHVYVTSTNVNVRKVPDGNVVISVNRNTIWPITGATQNYNGYLWYPIQVNSASGWIRGDCCYQLTAAQEAELAQGLPVSPTAVATATPVPTPVYSNYVITTLDKVNLRSAPSKDATAKENVALGTVMEYTGTTISGASTWYKVNYQGQTPWVLKSCIKVMTSAEYAEYADANPTPTPVPPVYLGHVTTTKTGVNLRNNPDGASIGQLKKGETYPYSASVKKGKYTWYLITVDENTKGYVRSDCVKVVEPTTAPTATPGPTATLDPDATATPTPAPTATPDPQSGQEASYSTLRLGSTGQAVKNLVQELINQGYYTGSVTSTYTSAVRDAVMAFQQANGLTADGVAGAATQHRLFGTVPEGQGTTTDLTMTLYAAEKIDWYTGGIQDLIPKGANFKVYDVYTGVVWWAHRWSGGFHADIEPLTAADTARLCQIYGVSKASDIEKNNMWQRRPCLVTIGTRTFACSLYGIPHGTQTITNNNFPGQVCLHFTNSKTHGGQKVDSNHAAAIEYAWKNAPNGHK